MKCDLCGNNNGARFLKIGSLVAVVCVACHDLDLAYKINKAICEIDARVKQGFLGSGMSYLARKMASDLKDDSSFDMFLITYREIL